MNRTIVFSLAAFLCACSNSGSYVPNPPTVKVNPLAEDAPENFLPIRNAAPFYPRNALDKRIQGYAIIEYDVLPDGNVVNPRFVKGYPEGYFINSSLITVQKYMYPKSEFGYKNVTTKISYALAQ